MLAPVLAPYIRDADFAARLPWHVAKRRLLDYLLVYFQEGECRFTVDDLPLSFTAGEVCLIQPGQAVELRGLTYTVTPYAHFDLFYHPLREQSFATRPGQMDLEPYAHLRQPSLGGPLPAVSTARFRPPNREWVEQWMRLVGEWRRGSPLDRQRANLDLGSLMIQLLQGDREEGLAKAGAGSKKLAWLESYLSTHLAEPIAVADMARQAGLSASRFQAVFRESYGVSPARYLLELRVKHAGELLFSTGWTLAHIAELCGFADVHHFAKTFRRLTGLSPGEHRRSGRLKIEIIRGRRDGE